MLLTTFSPMKGTYQMNIDDPRHESLAESRYNAKAALRAWVDALKPTPGPWFYDGVSPTTGARIIHSATCSPIAETFGDWISGTDQEVFETAEANARLIAAAPELLAALKLVNIYYGEDSDVFHIARAAIAKAEAFWRK